MSEQYKNCDSVLTGQDKAKIYSLTDELKFNQLLSVTEKICFGYQPDYPEIFRPANSEAEIVAKIGSFGIRTALDHRKPIWDYSDIQDQEYKTEHDRFILPDSVLRIPIEFNDSTKLEIVYQAEQFGQVMLDKAFGCLGSDAADKARQIKQATTDLEQLEIIFWLDNRLRSIASAKHGIVQDESFDLNDGLYHPVRLSPLGIGKYPDVNIAPTCLGVSILAASFFEKAQLNHLHAGVMQSHLECEDAIIANTLRESISRNYLPDHMKDYFDKIATNIEKRSVTDNGFHAANVVQLASGKWLQFDSNFSSIDFLNQEEVDQCYEQLISLKDIVPGLETTFVDPRTLAAGVSEIIQATEAIEYNYDDLKTALLDSDESIEQSIRSVILEPLYQNFFKDDQDGENQELLADSLEHAFSKCLERLVLWNNPIDAVRQRALVDKAYLNRVVEDLQSMWRPTLLMMLVVARDLQADLLQTMSHAQLELGLPAQRVGFAVLNDFDSYLNSGLSANFWLNNWPSQVPRIEAIDSHNQPGIQADNTTARNNAAWLHSSMLRYSKADGIINSHLQLEGAQSAEGQSQEAR